jgi:unsaturated rhamnogalacturonyl hydrolase
MAAQDTDNARLAPIPLQPWGAAEATSAALAAVAGRVAGATWRLGLRRWFWGEGVCLLGLVQAGQVFDGRVPARVVDWYDERLLAAGVDPSAQVEHVNELAPGTAAVALAGDSRTGRTAYLAPLRRLAGWAQAGGVTRAANGAIEHWPGGVWADTMYMAGVFLARLGVALGDGELARAGVAQVLAHAEILQADTGLFVHGSHRGEVIPCHWGRANAWAALAMVEVLEVLEAREMLELAQGSAAVAAVASQVRDRLGRQLAALASLQPDHGVWDVLVDGQAENRGILETSAAAGIGAAMLRAAPLLDADLAAAGWRAVLGTLAYVDDAGLLTRVSAGTVLQLVPFGYSVIRDDRPQPWGQGLMLTALAAAGQAIARGDRPH